MMDPATYLPVIEAESAHVRSQALREPTAPVPHCPEWDCATLLVHLGNVYRFIAAFVSAAPASLEDVPARTTEEPSGAELGAWFDTTRSDVIEALAGAGTDTAMWTWSDSRDSAFFHRRMAHESTMHRLDADLAVDGSLGAVEPAFASDGIDEFVLVGLRHSMRRPERTYPDGSLHLHCTDTEGEWMVVPDGSGGVTVTREHAKGDVAVRGPAVNVLRYVWGRERENVEVFGDEGLADAWARYSP